MSAITVIITAWDTANNAFKTGDAGNISVRLIKDGTSTARNDATAIAEVDATNCPGAYSVVLDDTDRAAGCVEVVGVSSTTGVVIFGAKIVADSLVPRATATTITIKAWDTAANAPKTGDAGNLSVSVIADGVRSAYAGAITEVDATNCPGDYSIALGTTAMDADCVSLWGVSATSGVVVFGPQMVTGELPGDQYVLDGVAYGQSGDATPPTGNVVLPSVDDVRLDVGYGSNGADRSGTVLLPPENKVELDFGYGYQNGLEFTGTLAAPTVVVPAEGDVRLAVDYGTDGTEFTGTLALPAEGDVEAGVGFGAAGSEFTGTLQVPAEADVESGTGYGAGGTEHTGALQVPAEADVQSGVGYGDSGTEHTGTFAAPAEGDVEAGVGFGAAGSEFTGSFVVPAEGDVESGVTYGNAEEFTGTLVVGGSSAGSVIGSSVIRRAAAMNPWYRIDDYFEAGFNTQVIGGVATDADALPTFRVYEENNETAVATGDCAKRDDANTTGYYVARGQCTAAAGFEVGKLYHVRVAATVDGVSGADEVGQFVIVPDNVWDALMGGTDQLEVDLVAVSMTGPVSLLSIAPVAPSGAVVIWQNADYKADMEQTISFSLPVAEFGDLSGLTIQLETHLETLTGTLTDAGGASQGVTFALTHTQTLALSPGQRGYEIWVIEADGDRRPPIASGLLTVRPQHRGGGV